MAKTLGCHLTAVCRGSFAAHLPDESTAADIIARLNVVEGNLGSGAWGYEFDVQTRWAFYPAGSSNLIATVFVGRGLALAGVLFEREEWAGGAIDSARFVCDSLLRETESGCGAFYYTPDARQLVHNANLLGAALCSDVTPLGYDEGAPRALEAARVSIGSQSRDGSWPYGDARNLSWIDSFHTAYVLDGLLQVWLVTGDETVWVALQAGTLYWTSNFFGKRGEPRYHHDGSGAYDIHSAATAVDVGSRLATWGVMDAELPQRVAAWTRKHLVNPSTGRTYYRTGTTGVDRRHFARWGDAHWALARASLLLLEAGLCDPLETAVRKVRA